MTVIYSMGVSADGYVNGPDGDFTWGAPDAEQFALSIEQVGALATYFCGRRLYEIMLPWELDENMRYDDAFSTFADIWTALPKVVFSTTLDRVEGNARLARGSIQDELAAAPEGIVSIGGPTLAAQCVLDDLIDEYRMFVSPVILGGGTPYFPRRESLLELELVESRSFERSLYQRYRRVRAGS